MKDASAKDTISTTAPTEITMFIPFSEKSGRTCANEKKDKKREYEIIRKQLTELEDESFSSFTIYSYMVDEYQLSGNDLLIYAFMLSKGKPLKFGDIKTALSSVTKTGLQNAIQRLRKQRLVGRLRNGKSFLYVAKRNRKEELVNEELVND